MKSCTPPPCQEIPSLRNEPLVFAPTKFLSVRNEDPGLARGQNDKNGAEYASNSDFKKFQPRSENLGRGQLITRPNKKQGSAFSKPQPGSTKETRNVCFCMLGERSEEKNLLYKQLFFRYAGHAHRGEKFAAQRKNVL